MAPDLIHPIDNDPSFTAWQLPEFPPSADESTVEDVELPSLPTVEEIEQIRAEAAEDGRAQGHAEGYEAGLAQAREEVERQQERLRGWLVSLSAPLTDLDDEVGLQLTRLAAQMAAAIVHRELTLTPDDIRQVANEAIAALPANSRSLTIYCHPDEVAALSDAAGADDWTIRSDDTVRAGGLVVAAGDARIDATLESRWADLSLRLLNQVVPGPEQFSPETAGRHAPDRQDAGVTEHSDRHGVDHDQSGHH